MTFALLSGLANEPRSEAREGWFARLREAEFDGVPFFTLEGEWEFGRRITVHEYPQRDLPNAEDHGRKADRFRFDAFLVGPDYDRDRDALIEAIRNHNSPRELVTERWGSRRVVVETGRVRETSIEGRWCRISIEAVEAGANLEPSSSTVTENAVEEATQNAAVALLSQFLQTFRGASDTVARWARDRVSLRVVEAIETLERDGLGLIRAGQSGPSALLGLPEVKLAARILKGQIGGLGAAEDSGAANSPASFGSDLIDLYLDFARIDATGKDRARFLEELRHVDEALPGALNGPYPQERSTAFATIIEPASLAADRANHQALGRLTRRAMVIARTLAALEIELPSLDETLRLRDDLLIPLDAEIDIASGSQEDEAHIALRELRATVIDDLSTRGARLTELATYTPPKPVSTLLLSQRLYGTGERHDELEARIRPRHPGFIPAAEPLRVLSA
jgi:prophage DNA circulation protein